MVKGKLSRKQGESKGKMSKNRGIAENKMPGGLTLHSLLECPPFGMREGQFKLFVSLLFVCLSLTLTLAVCLV